MLPGGKWPVRSEEYTRFASLNAVFTGSSGRIERL
jgi:hypothetical protein